MFVVICFAHRLAIIGVTEQYINQHVERDSYMDCVGQLQSHVSRLNHRYVLIQVMIYNIQCNVTIFTHVHTTVMIQGGGGFGSFDKLLQEGRDGGFRIWYSIK